MNHIIPTRSANSVQNIERNQTSAQTTVNISSFGPLPHASKLRGSSWTLSFLKHTYLGLKQKFSGLNASHINPLPLHNLTQAAHFPNQAEVASQAEAAIQAQKTFQLPAQWRQHANLFSFLIQLGLEPPANLQAAADCTFDHFNQNSSNTQLISLIMNQALRDQNGHMHIDVLLKQLDGFLKQQPTFINQQFKADAAKFKQSAQVLSVLENVFNQAMAAGAINITDSNGSTGYLTGSAAFTRLFKDDCLSQLSIYIKKEYIDKNNDDLKFSPAIRQLKKTLLQQGDFSPNASNTSKTNASQATVALLCQYSQGINHIAKIKTGEKTLRQVLWGYRKNTSHQSHTRLGRFGEDLSNFARHSFIAKSFTTGVIVTLTVLTLGLLPAVIPAAGGNTTIQAIATFGKSIPSNAIAASQFIATHLSYLAALGVAGTAASILNFCRRLYRGDVTFSTASLLNALLKMPDIAGFLALKMTSNTLAFFRSYTLMGSVYKKIIEAPLRHFTKTERDQNYLAYQHSVVANQRNIFIAGIDDQNNTLAVGSNLEDSSSFVENEINSRRNNARLIFEFIELNENTAQQEEPIESIEEVNSIPLSALVAPPASKFVEIPDPQSAALTSKEIEETGVEKQASYSEATILKIDLSDEEKSVLNSDSQPAIVGNKLTRSLTTIREDQKYHNIQSMFAHNQIAYLNSHVIVGLTEENRNHLFDSLIAYQKEHPSSQENLAFVPTDSNNQSTLSIYDLKKMPQETNDETEGNDLMTPSQSTESLPRAGSSSSRTASPPAIEISQSWILDDQPHVNNTPPTSPRTIIQGTGSPSNSGVSFDALSQPASSSAPPTYSGSASPTAHTDDVLGQAPSPIASSSRDQPDASLSKNHSAPLNFFLTQHNNPAPANSHNLGAINPQDPNNQIIASPPVGVFEQHSEIEVAN